MQDKYNKLVRIFKIVSIPIATGFALQYQIKTFKHHVMNIIDPKVLRVEKKYISEYIYIDDPTYNNLMEMEMTKKINTRSHLGWRGLRATMAWRMLWLCRHGDFKQRNIALEKLASFQSSKAWVYHKLAQAMDKNTAVLLARTRGADLRYFLLPPIHIRRAILSPSRVSLHLQDMICAVNKIHPHNCINNLITKHQMSIDSDVETDTIPVKPNRDERDLCLTSLEALYHHLSLFYADKYDDDASAKKLIDMGILHKIAELFLRYPNDIDVHLATTKLLTVLSMHQELLEQFFQCGLIRELCNCLRTCDVRLSSYAAVSLANISGEDCYPPGMFLLYPIYRNIKRICCDVMLVHGLRGSVFVTWRQRDRKCMEPLSLMDGTVSQVEGEKCQKDLPHNADTEFKQVDDDYLEYQNQDDFLLTNMDVVLHDIPMHARLERKVNYTAENKCAALAQENEDRSSYTFCWPRDWLPKEFNNLRILGVNYWSSLSDWLESCPLQRADIATKAQEMATMMLKAKVGQGSPIVWLTHSMGGLIVKKLLVDASDDDTELRSVATNTKCIIFYSTPHKGSALATVPRPAAALLWPSNDVKQLQINSPILTEINNKFLAVADQFDWETVSFAELKPTLITAFKVPVRFVEVISADLGRGEFYALPLDHICICKPPTRQSVLYTSVVEILRRATKHSEACESSLWANFKGIVHLNILRNLAPDDNSFRWYEKVLINTFTDGFTD